MHFERNQLFRVSLGFSPLIQAHPRECQLTTGSGLPFCFRRTSPWPGLDRRASGRIPVTSRSFERRTTLSLRACRFRYGFLLKQLTSPLRYTPCPVFQNGRCDAVSCYSYNCLATASFVAAPFTPQLTVPIMVSSSFHPACAVLFSFLSPYYCAIGPWQYV
jgi:hypothetical protein